MSACRLIPGFHGLLIQTTLIITAFLTLVLKRRLERGSRTWSAFLLDSSKQMIGAGWVHILNLALSVRLKRKTDIGDSCDWYFANIVVDCSFGTFIEFISFTIISGYVIPYLFSSTEAKEFQSGLYAGRRSYMKQLSVWLMVVTLMKLVVYVFLRTNRNEILEWSDMLLSGYQESPETKLVIVMVLTPLIMNSFQLWIIDNFIKAKPAAVLSDLQHSLLKP